MPKRISNEKVLQNALEAIKHMESQLPKGAPGEKKVGIHQKHINPLIALLEVVTANSTKGLSPFGRQPFTNVEHEIKKREISPGMARKLVNYVNENRKTR